MHELASGQTSFIPSFAQTPKFFLSEPSVWVLTNQRGVIKKEKKNPPKMLIWRLSKVLSSSCFTRELPEILNNFLQVSWDSRCSLRINLLKMFSVGGWMNISWKSTAGSTSPSGSPSTTCPAPWGNKNFRKNQVEQSTWCNFTENWSFSAGTDLWLSEDCVSCKTDIFRWIISLSFLPNSSNSAFFRRQVTLQKRTETFHPSSFRSKLPTRIHLNVFRI